MRRIDDGHGGCQESGLPFKVLAATDSRYLSVSPQYPPPPPPRAPEPYKVASSTTTFGRAHRNSSFVILAEPRPATPDSRSPSPSLLTGRVSPFRGRGFKGPPPRSRSRPQSPDNEDARRSGKAERRASLSQQYSPRRSLIPQPTRRRSISLSKTNDRSVSPKPGRRIDSRNRLSVSTSNIHKESTLGQRQFTKPYTRLSPIQGTPTKPAEKSEKNSQFVRRDRSKVTPRASPAKTPRNPALPPKSVSNSKRINQNQSNSRERLVSLSKIPLKSASTIKNAGSTSNLNAGRFISITNQSADKTQSKKAVKGVTDGKKDSSQKSDSSKTEMKTNESRSSQENVTNTNKIDNLVLLDLLKQSFNATGTSSVVNTTTTTAVQPLKIDPSPLPIDKDVIDKKFNSTRSHIENSSNKADNALGTHENSPAAGRVENGVTNGNKRNVNEETQQLANDKSIPKNAKPSNGNQRSKPGTGSNVDSPAATDTVSNHSKSNSISQSVKNFSRVGREQISSNGQGSAGQRSYSKNHSSSNSQKSANTNEEKAYDDVRKVSSEVPQNGNSAVESVLKASTGDESKKDSVSKSVSANEKSNSTSVGNGKPESADAKNPLKTSPEADSKPAASKSERTSSETVAMNGKTNHVLVGATIEDAHVASSANDTTKKRRNGNGESNASVKSSIGISNASDGSVGSADTGVSVNTVRGVSSPREKTGVHVVKRPQEIETLSGNVMHLEQNGDPTVPATGNAAEESPDVPEGLLARWRKSLRRYSKCCPNMRCLACRRDPKGSLWPSRKQPRTVTQPTAMTANTNDAPPPGCWTSFKNGCRCSRLPDCKCCTRRARVAPAESTTCCPPEGRFGTMCRQLFNSCKCKRDTDTQRRQSIRAKHSLTSVAPPPLSEEPKSKIPEVLVEHNSVMRGAIPCLPVPLAWFCLVWNVLLPGSGTVWSGLFNLCVGQPRFSTVAGMKSRLGAFIVNLLVGVGQLFTVLFCLVGWGWSIWWGVMMIRLARKYKRFKNSEAANGDPEARAGESSALPPGVPSQALRGMERVR